MTNFVDPTKIHFMGQNGTNGHLLGHGQTNGYIAERLNGWRMETNASVAHPIFLSQHVPTSCNISIPDPFLRNGRKRSHDQLFASDIKKSRCEEEKEVRSPFGFQAAFSWSDANVIPVSRPTPFGTPISPSAMSPATPCFPLSSSFLEHQTMMNAECQYNRSLLEEMIMEAHGC